MTFSYAAARSMYIGLMFVFGGTFMDTTNTGMFFCRKICNVSWKPMAEYFKSSIRIQSEQDEQLKPFPDRIMGHGLIADHR